MQIHNIFQQASKEGHQSLCFAEILPDSDPEILSQLVGKDRVHGQGVENIEALQTHRLGGPFWNRTCYAVLKGEDVQAAIYVHKQAGPVRRPFDFAGDVKRILSEPAEEFNVKAEAFVCYSISNVGTLQGSGKILIQQLHGHVMAQSPEIKWLATLSPLRKGMDEYVESIGLIPARLARMTGREQQRIAYDYLATLDDPVQAFHMANGAVIGDVKLGADTSEGSKYGYMVSYIYPRDAETLTQNQIIFKSLMEQKKDGISVCMATFNQLVHPDLLKNMPIREEAAPAPVLAPV